MLFQLSFTLRAFPAAIPPMQDTVFEVLFTRVCERRFIQARNQRPVCLAILFSPGARGPGFHSRSKPVESASDSGASRRRLPACLALRKRIARAVVRPIAENLRIVAPPLSLLPYCSFRVGRRQVSDCTLQPRSMLSSS